MPALNNAGPAFSADTLLQMAPYLAKFDIDATDFIDRLDILPNVFLQHDAWFDRDKVLEAGNELARITGNPFAGAYAGADVPIAGFGTWGKIISQAESLQQACDLMRGKLHMVERGSKIAQISDNGEFQLAYTLEGEFRHNPLQIQLATVAMMKNVALLCGEPDAVRVHLRMPWRYDARNLDERFGHGLIFGSTFDGIEISGDVLANSPLNGPTKNSTTEAIDTTIATAVLIDEMLPSGNATVHQTATRLFLSVRTLQRRLKHCGVAFEDLLDVTRRDIAIASLAGGASSMAELAQRLGYSDPANFARAFKRWTGEAPTKFGPKDRF